MGKNWGTARWIFTLLAFLVVTALAVNWWHSELADFQREAFTLSHAMHVQMATGDLAGIYNGADEQFRNSITREGSDALFKGIARKVGAPLDCLQGETKFFFGTEGLKLTSLCETHFSKNATGVETFTWHKTGDGYSLLNYNISSKELMER